MKFETKKAHDDIDKIFKEILPKFDMTERQEQIKLAHTMLDAMINGSITLSDAGTGIGKTYAYLTAGVVFNRYRIEAGEEPQPIVISTAAIALQKAVHDEYIPFLSEVLQYAGYIEGPILSVIRKGKSRYVCDKRLRQRLSSIDLQKKNSRNAKALLALKHQPDMDRVENLSDYDRRQVAVPRNCGCGEKCRYNRYLADCASGRYLFQICNHNLLIADAMHTKCGRHPILPNYCALIIDEAHKLPDTAKQMFGRTITYDDIFSLALSLKKENYPLAAHNLIAALRPIAKDMTAVSNGNICDEVLLKNSLRTLENIKYVIGDELSNNARLELVQMLTTLELFTDEESDVILYQDEDEYGRPALCGAAGDTAEQMRKTLWEMETPMLLTSGTLAVGTDFSRFKEQAGLKDCIRIRESVFHSPFDYEHNCLLYVPYSAPVIQNEDVGRCYRDLAEDIAGLVERSNGHALILFNSYSAMSAVRELLDDCGVTQPMFVMSRNSPHILNAFRESGNGILLAAGAAWEGMDFPGDIVSMLIIPRLPFPIPDAFSDRQKEKYPTLRDFIRAVALPDMQIKLRQGFGRAVRLETDACVVAVLDDRALRGRRYHNAMKHALPDMPMTGSIRSVEKFLQEMKDEEYFKETHHE